MKGGLSHGLVALGLGLILLSTLSPLISVNGGSGEERVVVATTTIIWDIARNVAGGLWRVEYIVEPGRDPHTYEPTPADLVKASRAQLILYNGFSIDLWVERLVRAASRARAVRVTEGLEALVLRVPDGPYRGREDPHLWMDPNIAIRYAENIRDALAGLDPLNGETYRRNAAIYIEQLRSLDRWIRERVSEIPPSRRMLFTQENAFQYFARAYGFVVAGYFYSIVTEIEPSPLDVVRMIERVRASGLCVFFIETTLSPRMMEMFTRQVGGRLGGRLYTDSIGPVGSEVGSYIGMMRFNVETITRELSRWC
jgi:manganese/iron transport system substrate-binding protein